MKRIFGILLALLLVVGTGAAWGMGCTNPSAGAVTTTSDKEIGSSGVRLLQVSYTTHSSAGTFTCTTNNDVTGWILLVETDPGTIDDNYTVLLNNTNGRDVMGGAMSANRDTANTEAVMPLLNGNYTVIWNEGPLSIAVSSAGNSKTAELLIYYLP